MLFQAHRGVSTEYPENTMPAFEAAFEQGYPIIELDPIFTTDGYCVVFHDRTINRTCRTPEGNVIEEPINPIDLTFEQITSLDAGLFMGEQFRGTRVPLLEEVMAYAAEKGLHAKLDNKFQKFNKEQREKFFDIIENSGADIGITCSTLEAVGWVTERFANATLHYDGPVSDESLTEVRSMLKNNPLVVWLPMQSELTTWVKVPFVDEELCRLVKKHGALLGLWILETEEQLKKAESFGADIIETTGSIKPR